MSLGLLVGVLSVTSSGPPLVLGVLALAALGALISWWLPAGPVLIVALVTMLPRPVLFERGIGVAGGALKVTDLILVISLVVWATRWSTGRAPRLPPPFLLMLIATFIAFAALGVATAHFEGSSVKVALTELRPLLSYLLVFPMIAGVRSIRDLQCAWLLVLGACTVASSVTIWLYLTGQGDVATFSGGAIRVTEIPFVPPLVLLLWSLLLLAYSRRSRGVVFVACGALATGALFFTFQRAAWVTAVIGLAAILIALPVRRRRRLLTLLLPTLVAAIGTVLILNAASVVQLENPLTAGLDRIESLTQFSQDSSNQHRVAEAHAAIKQIDAHPFTGIGLGNTITFISPLFNTATNQPGVVVNEFYIHNSYLWFPLKLGIPGAVVFITLIAVSLGLGVTAVRRLSSPNRKVLALGATLIVASLAVISTAGPHLNGDNTAPMLALAIATICLVRPAGERELPS